MHRTAAPPPSPSPLPPNAKIAFVAPASVEAAQVALEQFRSMYPSVPPAEADVVVAIGGDGFMLESLHRFMGTGKPIYGINRGTVGFLMNVFRKESLPERLARAQPVILHPLRMMATMADGNKIEALAINEVSLLRESRQTAKIRITMNGKVRLAELAADGVME